MRSDILPKPVCSSVLNSRAAVYNHQMGLVIVENMSQGGLGENPSSSKIHPFFSGAASSLAVAAGPTNRARKPREPDADPKTVSFSSNPKDDGPQAKRQKSEHLSCQDSTPETIEARPPCEGSSLTSSSPGLSHHVVTDPPQLTSALTEARDTKTMVMSEKGPTHKTSPASRFATMQPKTLKTSLSSDVDTIPSRETSTAPVVKKILRFNTKTGKLGSPPREKRKPRSSFIVRLKYGKDAGSRKDVGQKITQIMHGTLHLPRSPRQQRSTQGVANHVVDSASVTSGLKVTHPFFTSKNDARSSTPDQSSHSAAKQTTMRKSVFMSTPVSPSRSRNSSLLLNSSRGTYLGIKRPGTKVPGSRHPMWPSREMAHVRDLDSSQVAARLRISEPAQDRKFKGQPAVVGPRESLMAVFLDGLQVDTVRQSLLHGAEDLTFPSRALRIPKRHFESGRKLRDRMRPQLTVTTSLGLEGKEDISQDELAGPPPAVAHPAVSHLYVSLSRHLSSYDRSTCESKTWTQKYTPSSALQVGQRGKDALHIKTWLEAMKVQSVETGKSDVSGDGCKSRSDLVPKKKRRKTKTDDFIVDTDDEGSEMEETSDHGEEDQAHWRSEKSVMRFGSLRSKEPGRLRNTIVISGPHGCGKTAAVFAIAAELDYEVFEINASNRRSGKDILEKVGDMAQNHLVQQHRAGQPAMDGGSAAGTPQEPESSKQGTMTSFFTLKKTSEEKKKKKKSSQKQVKGNGQASSKKGPAKAHKQSIILIEEADILYEEDKQFWATLMSLMCQSRRPFIVTCNDESQVPLQSLQLHGIFRFAPAPMSMAVDICMLIAANEGHMLRRSAVEGLYRSRGHDLRATICELNFWCQIGVGDRRGGFDWFYLRWPRGCDLDEQGDTVRVISENTYQYGMGWIGRDAILAAPNEHERQMEAMQQSWDFWRVDMGASRWKADLEQSAQQPWCSSSPPRSQKLMMLEALDSFCQMQSDADILSKGSFATQMQLPLDPTQPDIPAAEARDNFIIGRALLDAAELLEHATYSQDMALTLKSRARERLMVQSQWPQQCQASQDPSVTGEKTISSTIDASFDSAMEDVLSRTDISVAFDPIAIAPKAQPSAHLDASVFDGTMRLIVLDVAPWIRGIIAFEDRLMQERAKLNELLGEGAGRKRMRKTRSAYSALEGGERKTTRKERYFGDRLSTRLVMRTGRVGWQKAVTESTHLMNSEADARSSQPSVEGQSKDAMVA